MSPRAPRSFAEVFRGRNDRFITNMQCRWFQNYLSRGTTGILSWLPAPSPYNSVQFSSVQSLSRVRLLATPWIAAHQASLSITNSQSSLRLTSIESVMPSSNIITPCQFLDLSYSDGLFLTSALHTLSSSLHRSFQGSKQGAKTHHSLWNLRIQACLMSLGLFSHL